MRSAIKKTARAIRAAAGAPARLAEQRVQRKKTVVQLIREASFSDFKREYEGFPKGSRQAKLFLKEAASKAKDALKKTERELSRATFYANKFPLEHAQKWEAKAKELSQRKQTMENIIRFAKNPFEVFSGKKP